MKRITRPGRLQLNKATLRHLTARDLQEVVGGLGRVTQTCTAEGGGCSGTCTCSVTCPTISECTGGAM